MAAPPTLPALLTTLTDSLTSATSSLPSTTNLTPPAEGISLLDTKNELLLSYLHNLVFLIILKLRNQSPSTPAEETPLNDAVTQKLVELRIYIEKGVRPLESRLKYQLDKLLLAASEASSIASIPNTAAIKKPRTTKPDTANSDASASASDDDAAEPALQPPIPDLTHRPNPSAFARPSDSKATRQSNSDGVYKPPRITPTALPTTDATSRKKEVKPRKSHTLNEFIREEMDEAPVAEPSIGAGSGLRGREKEEEEERRAYEELRLVRLPGERKKKKKDGRAGEGFGEDLVGGLGDFEFEGLKGRGGKRRREREGGDEGRVGQAWEKRVRKGVERKRR